MTITEAQLTVVKQYFPHLPENGRKVLCAVVANYTAESDAGKKGIALLGEDEAFRGTLELLHHGLAVLRLHPTDSNDPNVVQRLSVELTQAGQDHFQSVGGRR